MKPKLILGVLIACLWIGAPALFAQIPSGSDSLGLPPMPVPAHNPQTPEKIALGKKLFEDKRFSSTGEVSCSTCHDSAKAFTDSPLQVSEGIEGLTGTRNAPTVINAAYFTTQFWDGRSPSLEDQALHPFVNPVEMGLENHEPILEVILQMNNINIILYTLKIYVTIGDSIFRESKKYILLKYIQDGKSILTNLWMSKEPSRMIF